MKIDEIDLVILNELQKDSRLSMRELSKKVNLSAPAVAERVRKLEDLGVIACYTIQVNHTALGFPVDCLLEITIKNGEYDRFKGFITTHHRCIFCYRIAGAACFLVKLSVRTIAEIEDFINSVSAFARTVTHIVFSEVPVQIDFVERLK